MTVSAACPCGSGSSYQTCCKRWHDGSPAPTAEALMRSRYTAYVLGLEPYLLATWHASTRPAALGLGQSAASKWLGLDVLRHTVTGPAGAVVEFVARSRAAGGRAVRLHEVSRFVLEDNAWFYVDGEHRSAVTPRRLLPDE